MNMTEEEHNVMQQMHIAWCQGVQDGMKHIFLSHRGQKLPPLSAEDFRRWYEPFLAEQRRKSKP